MPKPKFLKPVLIGCACLAPVGLIVGLSVNWDHTKTISCIGSSGVKPFMDAFGESFRKSNNGYDVTVDSGGSTYAISQVANGYCNFGNASKNTYNDVHKDAEVLRLWETEKLKTVTIGWEAIGIIYHIPNGLTQNAINHFDLYMCNDNINYLYAAFSGFDEYYDQDNQIKPLNKEFTSFYQFLTPDAKANMTEADIAICKNTQIVPATRSGGATVANSSLSFAIESNLNVNMTPKQKMAFTGGQFGSDRKVIQTDESNAKGYEAFDGLNEKYPGLMVYLTSAFTEPEKTKKIISDNKSYKFMSYQPSGSNNIFKYEYDNFDNGYDFIRPLNIAVRTKTDYSKFEDNKKFIDFLFGDNYEDILKKNGAKALKTVQWQTMLLDNKFWVGDLELEATRTEDTKNIYGAIR